MQESNVFAFIFFIIACTLTLYIKSHNPSGIYYWHEIQVPLYALEIPKINMEIIELYFVKIVDQILKFCKVRVIAFIL